MSQPPSSADRPGRDRDSVLVGLLAQQLDAVVVTDADLNVTEYAGAAERVYGWSRAEILGKPWLTFVPTEITSADAADVWRRLREGVEIRTEARHQRKDGTWVDLEVSATPTRDANGQVTGWLGIGRDVTAERTLREQNRALRERLERVLDGSRDGFMDANLQTGAVYRSPSLARMLGLDPSEIAPHVDGMKPFVHPDDLPRFEAAFSTLASGGSDHVDIEARLRHRDGHWVWVEARGGVTQCDTEGRPTRISGAIVDLSTQKALEFAARAREQQLRAFFDSPAVGIAIIGPDGRCSEVNDCACRMLGYSREELAQLTWMDLTHPDDRTLHVDALGKLLAGEIDSFRLDQRYVRKDGSSLWALVSVSGIRAGDGHVATRIAILADIGDRKQADEALSRSERRYHHLFTSLAEQVTVWDVLRDETGRMVNWRLRESNAEGQRFFGDGYATALGRTFTELFGTEAFEELVARGEEILDGPVTPREMYFPPAGRFYRAASFALDPDTIVAVAFDITDARQAQERVRVALAENEELVGELRAALNKVKALSGILPICSYCKKIRDDQGYWERVEEYISTHTDAMLSHGVCPECEHRFFT